MGIFPPGELNLYRGAPVGSGLALPTCWFQTLLFPSPLLGVPGDNTVKSLGDIKQQTLQALGHPHLSCCSLALPTSPQRRPKGWAMVAGSPVIQGDREGWMCLGGAHCFVPFEQVACGDDTTVWGPGVTQKTQGWLSAVDRLRGGSSLKAWYRLGCRMAVVKPRQHLLAHACPWMPQAGRSGRGVAQGSLSISQS